jgi:hypothetical protein
MLVVPSTGCAAHQVSIWPNAGHAYVVVLERSRISGANLVRRDCVEFIKNSSSERSIGTCGQQVLCFTQMRTFN